MSDTPRTDKVLADYASGAVYSCRLDEALEDLARQLERDLATWTEFARTDQRLRESFERQNAELRQAVADVIVICGESGRLDRNRERDRMALDNLALAIGSPPIRWTNE